MTSVKKIDDFTLDQTDDNEEAALEIDTSGSTSTSATKRLSSSSGSNEATAKKVRKKPQPQIIENMKDYFERNTLDHLTTATLRHWLKERSLACTTREKKDNLIQKVRKHFLEGSL